MQLTNPQTENFNRALLGNQQSPQDLYQNLLKIHISSTFSKLIIIKHIFMLIS